MHENSVFARRKKKLQLIGVFQKDVLSEFKCRDVMKSNTVIGRKTYLDEA